MPPLPPPTLPSRLAALSALPPLALLALAVVPAAQAGPIEDTLVPVWAVTDPAAECIDPQTGRCSHPCGDLEQCFDRGVGAIGNAQREADALVAEAGGAGCPGGCLGTLGEVVAAAAEAPGAVATAVNDTWAGADGGGQLAAADEAARGAAGKASAAAEGAVATAKSLPGQIEAALPTYVTATCSISAPGVESADFCRFWLDRRGHPLPEVFA